MHDQYYFTDDECVCCFEKSSLPSKNFPCISMDMLQIGALVLLGRLVEAKLKCTKYVY